MIRTAKDAGRALDFRHDSCGVMPADVIERSQLAVTAADNDQRLSRELGGNEVARRADLICARDSLPRPSKDFLPFEFSQTLVNVPGGGNGVSVIQRRSIVVRREDVGQGVHRACSGCGGADDDSRQQRLKQLTPGSGHVPLCHAQAARLSHFAMPKL